MEKEMLKEGLKEVGICLKSLLKSKQGFVFVYDKATNNGTSMVLEMDFEQEVIPAIKKSINFTRYK